MKALNFHFLPAHCLLLATAAICIACSKEEDEPLVAYHVATGYSLDLSATWFDFFDIEIDYATGGAVQTEKAAVLDWHISIDLYNEVVDEGTVYGFRAVAKPKSAHPEIDTGATYTFSCGFAGSVAGYLKNSYGETMVWGKSQDLNYSTLTVHGEEMEAFTSQEHELGTFSYTYAE